MSALRADPRDFPDPFVLNTGSEYIALATNSGSVNVQVMSSPDLVEWRTEPDGLPSLPSWAAGGNTWAPAVLPRESNYILFYTVREPTGQRQAISVATSREPVGPYVDRSDGPFIYQLELGGSIDPSPFVDLDGTPYLLWKADSNAIDRRSSLWIQKLTVEGTSLVGPAIRLLDHDASWETPLIEAPSLVLSGGIYYLFYSANWWNTDRYAIGYATATSVTGPYKKVTKRRPWFGSDTNVAGPGGQEWFLDRSEELCMAYHAWTPGRVGYPNGARSLHIARVSIAGAPALL
ncbi:MAG TPA: glycoside hydrolase family 43 protein [Acidimicrobiales bacterium]